MPITTSAKKALRASNRNRIHNDRRRWTMKRAIKNINKLAEAGSVEEARSKLPEAYKAIDKATKRGVIKENTAARKKSRLAAFLKRKTV